MDTLSNTLFFTIDDWYMVAPIGYLMGSIPFGYLLTKIFLKSDIREVGSGNIGATNVLRTGKTGLAFFTLLFDALKGAVAIYILLAFNFPEPVLDSEHLEFGALYSKALFIGFFVMVGHCFPIWLNFNGGKGVATTFGVLFAAVPWAGFLAAVTWGIVAGFTRYSSLAALSAVALTPLFTFIYYGAAPAIITILIAVLVIWRHKENIQRLSAGTESKIGAKKKETDEPAADTE